MRRWMTICESAEFVLYHGTSESPDTIRREGLKGDVFLTDNPQLALEYAESDQERTGFDHITLVSVHVDQLDQSLLYGDIDHTLTDDWRESLSETDQLSWQHSAQSVDGGGLQ